MSDVRNSKRYALFLVGLGLALALQGGVAEGESSRRHPIHHDPVRVWLHENAVHIKSVDSEGSITDLLPIAPWLGGADIIALGDGTHGTHEYYTIKRRLIQFMAETGIARTVVFEGPWPEFLRINDYVQGGEGNARELVKTEAFPFWETEEIVELVEWTREFNASRAPDERIELLGGDVVTLDSRSAADEVISFLQKVDPVAASAATSSYQCVPDQIKSDSCGLSATGVRSVLEQNAIDYQAASSRSAYLRALHSAQVVESSHVFFAVSPAEGEWERDRVRDEILAQYMSWFSEVWTGEERVVVWAHNEHIGGLPAVGEWKSMGQHLKEAFGDRYFTIGTCMLNGSLRRYALESSVVAMQPPLDTNYELLFKRAGWEIMAIPLFLPNLPSWLIGPAHLRFGSAGYDPSVKEFHNPEYSLPDKFDAIIYVRSTTPTSQIGDSGKRSAQGSIVGARPTR